MLRPDLHAETIARWLRLTADGETRLRLVAQSDAAFILRLRTDPVKARNLSKTESSVEAQQRWLEAYQVRFQAGKEAYFIIENKGVACGTVRLYDYRPAEDSFSWKLDCRRRCFARRGPTFCPPGLRLGFRAARL